MTTKERKPLPPDLLALIKQTGEAGILAGCTAEEIIALCRRTVDQWLAEGNRP